ncbi:MAG: hypothetical protein JXA33_22345 [Anaerolineae bacterium]|nr:hypothetical protein [Anaerolineae bacterium]
MLHGKGMFMWQIQNSSGGNPAQIVLEAQRAGLSYVAIKIADGVHSFPDTSQESLTVATVAAFQHAGIEVWGWQFIYGRDRNNTTISIADAEAQIAVQRARTLGVKGFIIDFENSGHAVLSYHGNVEDAEIYMRRLRAGLSDIPLAAASHRFPRYHSNLPWDTFMRDCNLAMPQVYWVQGDPVRNLRASWEEYRARWPQLPFVPIGSAYAEGGWGATAQEVTAFLQEARNLNLPAVNFWSWQSAQSTSLWETIATFPWPGGSPGPIVEPEYETWVLVPLKFRNAPSTDETQWIDGIIFPVGTRITAIGNPTAPDGQGRRLQKIRTAEGREGWVTYSGQAVYLTTRPISPLPPEDSPQRTVKVNASLGLKLRSQTLLDDDYWIERIVLPPETLLTAIGTPTQSSFEGYHWQYVETTQGQKGWVVYSAGNETYLQDWNTSSFFPAPAAGSPRRVVQVTASLGLKFRSQTSTDDQYWIDRIVFLPGQTLIAIAPSTTTDLNQSCWQYVQAQDRRTGWVKYSDGEDIYLRDVGVESSTTVWSKTALNIRATAAAQGAKIWTVADGTPLTVLEGPRAAGAKVGMPGQWIHVRTPSLKEGFVAAEYVRNGPVTDSRPLVPQVTHGESPYIFGFHEPFDQKIFAGSGKTGWMLMTEQVGANPMTACGRRSLYYEWSRAGFGVIARLNYGYDSTGTIPPQTAYSQFAAACARWVENSIDPTDRQHGCHIWIIGNEMNNPREWPGNHNGEGGTPITPEAYAACFNAVYAAIKAVQPGAIICPGAIDPYNAQAGDPQDWFKRMLAGITALDGIILHAYTHGAKPQLITSQETFQDHPLTWQYYHFYAYRTFMDLIPDAWREVPVFITETDQVDAWQDVNNGWVQAAYEEIHRWNQSPHHQQIQCLLLYRWPSLDQWAIEHKSGVIEDFKQALRHDYRWRLTTGSREHFTFGVPAATTPEIDVSFAISDAEPGPDDFKRIWGIGPKIETVLRAIGIQSFAQLAVVQPDQITEWLTAVAVRGRAVASWPRQAQLLADGKLTELATMQAELRQRTKA